MRTDTAIAQELPRLITVLRLKAQSNSEGIFAFAPTLVRSAELLASTMKLPEGKVTMRDKSERMRDLAAEIRVFIRAFRTQYTAVTGKKKAPAFCMRSNKKLDEYFQDFFQGFLSEPKDITAAITKKIGRDASSVAKAFAVWLPLYTERDKRAIDAAHLARAYDLKLVILGALRLYGMTNHELKKIMAGHDAR